MSRLEDEPIVEFIEGKNVARYLTPQLREKFIRQLVTALNGGIFDQSWYENYMKLFEYIFCLLINNEN